MLNIVGSVIQVGKFIWEVCGLIQRTSDENYNEDLSGTKRDRTISHRNKIIIKNNENTTINIDNSQTINIHVNNIDDIKLIIEKLDSEK